MPPSGIPLIGLCGLPTPSSCIPQSSSSSLTAALLPCTSPSSSDDNSTCEQSFMDPNTMPPPGVEHFEARRARWLTPREGWEAPEPPPSTSRAKLEALLASENAISSQSVWNAGIRNVWKGLVGGGRLRRRLPLGMVLKILQAGWLRDGTWPADGAGMPLGVPHAPPSPIRSPAHSPLMISHDQEEEEDDTAL